MVAWLLILFVGTLFMVINIFIGCYVAIRLGYGPPDWKTALNLVVRLTTLQDRLNAGRDWLDKKAPWADKYLDRLHVPRPIIIVEMPEEEEIEEIADGTSEVKDEATDEQTGDFSEVSAEERPDPLEPDPLGSRMPEAGQIPLEESDNADSVSATISRADVSQ